ncbi:hypothetical protein EI546_11965 [Aequorivita sp. H23M31]|uniref:Transglutaminase-like domain-containing protein n=1 Tax=Aequorivita ciconiae TaxID=2494375 RepID=A0A410G531_9FLAO|nr:transglutaminase domain-containing protein [Aequorivita sp. H23M31]QAA82388.1 hypothetical protein EI546_11965 [Aequorivita sp. H23M31]
MIRKDLYSIFLFILLGSTVYGQVGNIIGKRESRNTHTKKNETTHLTKKLAKAITKNSHSDSEKVYAIYLWIATNIVYDNQLHLNTNLQKKIYVSEENVIRNVLQRRMALCGGFAFLFKDLCGKVGISAEVVHGFTKNYSSGNQDYKKPTHTWNAVKLNGKWQLLDITWAVGYGTPEKPDDFWYFTKPTDFILSHYPENPSWTLLDKSISLSDFDNR